MKRLFQVCSILTAICSNSWASPENSTNAVIPYSAVDRLLRIEAGADTNKLTKAQAGMLSMLAPSPTTIVFAFPKSSAGKAQVEIVAEGVHQICRADSACNVKLKLDGQLAKKKAEVRLSEKPNRIVPGMD